MGVGGNFDPVLKLDGGEITPTGPLLRVDGEDHTDLAVWIVQQNPGGSGAFAVSTQDVKGLRADPKRWSTPPAPPQYGTFQEGPATAMAVLISTRESDGATTTFWWTESVTLQEEKPTSS